jgi:hypothetical protein
VSTSTEGGDLHRVDLTPITRRLTAALSAARLVGLVKRDDEARERWADVYGELTEGVPGLLGAITGRAEAQVMRFAMLFSLLDSAKEIGLVHLDAALEVWRYCAASAAYIFGHATGDPIADTILSALRDSPAGLNRTQIRDLFQRHASGARIDGALELLRSAQMAESSGTSTGGRPAEVWKVRQKRHKRPKPSTPTPLVASDAFVAVPDDHEVMW